jgi:methyl coenzyme M reductase subunit D
MQATQANVVVDVKQALRTESTENLLSELGALRGVRRARISQRARRLVLVDYDPAVTDSLSILGTVVRQGFDARLIGM